MKKSLSLLLAIAMVFSMFASVASAAEQELDAMAKFEALKEKGIFTGFPDGSAGLDQEMNRGQFAAVLVRLLQLDKKSSTPTYTDTAGHWAHADGYIEAVTAAGLMNGVGFGQFNPDGNVTIEQLATILVRAFELDVPNNANVSGASDWAQGYVAAAIAAQLIAQSNDYTVNAKRELLVESTYTVHIELEEYLEYLNLEVASVKATSATTIEVTFNNEQVVEYTVAALTANVEADRTITHQASGKQFTVKVTYVINSIESAAATGASKLTATFNAPVADTSKVTVTVKRGTATQQGAVSWSEDKKSATVTLNSKLREGIYTVEVSGEGVASGSKEVVATDERIGNIEILTTSEYLPLSNNVVIAFSATNQYGEKSELPASNFTIHSGNASATPISGKQEFKLDLKANDLTRNDRVPVTILHQQSNAQANKIFIVGEEPIVSKVEVGELKNASNETIASVNANSSAYLEYTAYDQYGIRVTDLPTLNGSKGITVVVNDPHLTKGEDNQAAFVTSVIGDDAPDLKLNATDQATEKEVRVTLFANGTGQSVSTMVRISTPKVPAFVEYANFNQTWAKGDDEKFVEIIVTDTEGNRLTTQEIADNASKFTVYATGGVVTVANNPIVLSGEHKGKIRIDSIDNRGNGSLVIQLRDKPSVSVSLPFSAGEERIPDRVAVTSAAAGKMLFGSTTNVKFKTFDQYNGDSKLTVQELYRVVAKYERVSGDDGAIVSVSKAGNVAAQGGALVEGTPTAYTLQNAFDTNFTFTASSNKTGIYRLTLTLQKTNTINNWDNPIELSTATSTVQVISGEGVALNYSVVLDKAVNNTLIAVPKHYAVTDATYADYLSDHPVLTKEVKVTARDSGGVNVALPSDVIRTVSVANTTIANSVGSKIVGLDKGTTTVTVLYGTPNGGAASSSFQLTVSEDVPAVESIVADKKAQSIVRTAIAGKYAWDSALMNKLTVKDQYGNEYVNQNANLNVTNYNNILKVTYYISDVKYKANTAIADRDVVTIDANTGLMSYTNNNNNIVSFTINAIAPNGKVATVEVSVDDPA